MALSTNASLPRIVIVGAGFGGIHVAQGLRHAAAQITVIDRRNHHLFQPLLYQVATAGLNPADIAAPIRSVLSGNKNTEVLLAEVEAIDVPGRRVLLKQSPQSVAYDYLVLATGARHSYFGHDEWAPFAPGLKTILDATNIRKKILLAFEAAESEPDAAARAALMTFVLVGAGPTGVEMAGAIAELAHQALRHDFRHISPDQAHIILVEAGPRTLTAFPADLADHAVEDLKRLGVEVRLNAKVEKVDADGVVINGKSLAAKTVIWAAGVMASPAGKWLNAETDRAGRVKVTPQLTVPGHPEIFVIGDTAAADDGKGKPLPGVAPAAMQAGNYVAKVLLARLNGTEETRPFKYFDKGNLATIGRSAAIADFGRFKLSGFLAWILWLFVHIFFLIGFRNRTLVFFQWAWSYLTFKRGARLITGEEETPPKIHS